MKTKRCSTCVGSGKVMGGGMLYSDCDVCDGTGKLIVEPPPLVFKLTKDNLRYKEAIQNIKELDPSLTDEEAEEIFNKELNKLDDIKDDEHAIRSTKKNRKASA
jgi:hypothetical protein